MNAKLAILAAAVLALSPAAMAQDIGNSEIGDGVIGSAGDASGIGQLGGTLPDDEVPGSGFEDITPSAGSDYFLELDSDDDAGLSIDEFGTGLDRRGAFDRWDTDRDGTLSRDEYNSGTYDRYDTDRDDRLDLGEFTLYNEQYESM